MREPKAFYVIIREMTNSGANKTEYDCTNIDEAMQKVYARLSIWRTPNDIIGYVAKVFDDNSAEWFNETWGTMDKPQATE